MNRPKYTLLLKKEAADFFGCKSENQLPAIQGSKESHQTLYGIETVSGKRKNILFR